MTNDAYPDPSDLVAVNAALREQVADLTKDADLLRQAIEALNAMVVEYCDYMTINKLGNPETQHNIKLARAALAAAAERGL